ncbi:MAG: hypothetical protein AAFX58_10280 [Pseudomonadota bacterium]
MPERSVVGLTTARRHTLYRLFKYTVYALLAWNVWLFFLEDLAASAETFVDGVTVANVVEAYSATFDTFAWVVLLLLFELETAAIRPERLTRRVHRLLSVTRAVCYFFIVYSFYGYLQKFGLVTDLTIMAGVDICELAGSGMSWLHSLDRYFPITPAVCEAYGGETLYRISGTDIVGTAAQMELARSLALTDVVNAGAWLIVVATLELEVLLQLRGRLSDRLLGVNSAVKAVLYAVLLGCAVYWGVDGEFLHFWDAFLWLVAFVFIELNIFNWQRETRSERG